MLMLSPTKATRANPVGPRDRAPGHSSVHSSPDVATARTFAAAHTPGRNSAVGGPRLDVSRFTDAEKTSRGGPRWCGRGSEECADSLNFYAVRAPQCCLHVDLINAASRCSTPYRSSGCALLYRDVFGRAPGDSEAWELDEKVRMRR